MTTWLKQSTATDIELGPFVDDADFKTAETGLTLSQADCQLIKNGGAAAQKNDSTSATHLAGGHYKIPLNTTDTNTVGRLRIYVNEAGALPVWRDFMVVPANVYDSLIGGTDALEVDATAISGDSTAADNLEAAADGTGYNLGGGSVVAASVTGNVGGNVTGSVGSLAAQAKADVNAEVDSALDTAVPGTPTANSINERIKAIDDKLPSAAYLTGTATSNGVLDALGAGIITAAAIASGAITDVKIATDAITAAKIATDAITEIQNGLATSAQLGTNGSALSAIPARTVEGTIDEIEAARLILAAIAGKSTGGGTATITFRDVADSKARITATVDGSGNRTAVTLDAS